MNWFGITILINLLILSVIYVQLTSSASFPNPPTRPPSNASPDEQALFWKLLHNYYAIIARPRFGKRSQLNDPSVVAYIDQASMPLSSSTYDMIHMLNENLEDGDDQRINVDNFYRFAHPDRRRRR